MKAIAARLTNEADQYAARIAPVAKEAGIKPPDVLRNDLGVRVSHMRPQDGFDFDRSDLDDQIASHEKAVRSEDVMTRQEYSQPLMGVAHAAQDLIRRNLADLRALRQQMGTAR